MTEQTTDTATTEAAPAESAQTTTPAELAKAETPEVKVPEPSRNATPNIDEYQKQVDTLLAAHEAKEEGKEPPPPEKLRDGESWDAIYKSSTPEVQRAMSSLRADYTKKTQELAAQRKEMAAERTKLEQLQRNLTESDAFKAIKEAASADTGEFDPYDPKSFSRYVEKAVAERMQQVLQPMYEEQMKAQSRQKLNVFMDKHPELRTDKALRAEVKELLVKNETMSLENAYWIIRGKKSSESQLQMAVRKENQKKAARAAGLKIGSGKKTGQTAPPTSSKMSASEIYSYLASQHK